MKKTYKFLALVLALVMSLSLVTITASAEDDLSEHVVLTMYCIGDEGGIHADEHLKLLNDLLTEKINAEIQPIMVSWGEYRQKLPMVWASGEAYDLTYAANWAGYYTEGPKGAFMDITELVPKYAPQTYALMEERGAIESLKIGGKLYMVPNYKEDWTSFVVSYREDLRKKYDCPEIVDEESLQVYLQALAENEAGMQPYGDNGGSAMPFQLFLNEQDWSRPLDNGVGFLVYDLQDPTHVFNVVDTPEYAEFIAKSRAYYEKGYVSKSIMAMTESPTDQFRAGLSGTVLSNLSGVNGNYQEILANHPDWEIGYYNPDLASGHVEAVTPANNGICVGAYSRHPERALMFVELMYTDEEVYSVLMNGIEGVTFEWDPETRTKWTPEGVDPSELSLRNLGMQFGYDKFDLGSLNDAPVMKAMKDEYRTCTLIPELAGFSINQDELSAELAAVKAVQDEYKIPLDKGVVDPETGLAQLKERLEAAGINELIEAVNAQIAEYLAN